MELIELDATAQRALELLTNAGMSDGSIYDYTHTGFGSILRHFHTKGILYATAEMLDNFLLEQRVLLDQGDISQWKWGLVRRSCELLKQCAAMNSIDLPDLQPWDPVWNRPKQIIQHDAPRRNSLPNRKIFMCLSGWSTSVWNNLAFRKIRFAITRKRD